MFKFFFDKNKDNNNNNPDEPVVKPANSICQGGSHQKSVDLYCKHCNLAVCSKCLKEHSSHSVKVVDIEDEFGECLKASSKMADNLKEFIKTKSQQKELNDASFKENVEEQFNKEQIKISDYFRDVHDALHFKEVELKRELKSHFEDNYEEYLKIISKIDHEIDHSHSLIKTIEENKSTIIQNQNIDSATSNSNNNAITTTSVAQQDKFQLLHRYIHSKNLLERQEQVDEYKYQAYSFVETVNRFEDLLRLLELKNTNAIHKFVYIYGNGGFERLNLTNKTLEKIEIKGEKFATNHGIFKAMVATHDHLYVFKRKNFLKYDPKTTEWTMGNTNEDFDGGDWQSADFDGKEWIYLFGGIRDGNNHSDISRFNIKTERFELRIAQSRIPIRFSTPRMVGDSFYILGGVASNSPDPIATLDRYDTKTQTTTLVRNFQNDGFSELTCLCYLPSNHSLYIITREHKFFRYDISSNSIHNLPQPVKDIKQYYTELAYDGDNTLYCISKDSIYEFSLSTQLWTKTEVPRFHNFDLYLYSIAYSPKF